MKNESLPLHETLMARFQEEFEPEAFSQIVSFYMNPALAAAKRVLLNQHLAEDAVQEAFLRVIRKRDQYDRSKPFSPWFYTILRNVCLDMLRKTFRQKHAIEQIAATSKSQKSQGPDSHNLEMLQSLSAGEQDVLILRVVHEMPFRDIAAALSISEEAAKKRAQRALRRLRSKINDLEQFSRQTG